MIFISENKLFWSVMFVCALLVIAGECLPRHTERFLITTDMRRIWATEVIYESPSRIRYTKANGKHGVVVGNFVVEELEQ